MDLELLNNIPPWEWPAETDEFLLKVVGSKRAKLPDRVFAAELCGELSVMNDEIAETLLSILKDTSEPEDLREQAAVSLGPALEYADTMEFDDLENAGISESVFPKIQRALQELYGDAGLSESLRRNVLESAARAPEKWHRKAVRAAYYSGDENWRLSAVFCMSYVRGFEKEIIESLQSSDPDIHIEAVCAAGVWGLDDGWEHIFSLASNERTERGLRLAAIDAVAGIRPIEAMDLLRALTTHEDEEVVEAAYEAIVTAEGMIELQDWNEEEDK